MRSAIKESKVFEIYWRDFLEVEIMIITSTKLALNSSGMLI